MYPGAYNETASNRYLSYNGGAGPYQFGIFINKAGITVKGVDGSGNDITNYSGTLASVRTNATNSFGYSGIFIDADNVTFQGIEVLDNYVSGVINNAKTIEIIGNNFSLKYCKINVQYNLDYGQGDGNIYFNDEHFSSNISNIQSYELNGNYFYNGGYLRIANGAGYSGNVANKKIINNIFNPGSYGFMNYDALRFDGTIIQSGSWYTHPVGGATITGNSFTNYVRPIAVRGDYDSTSFNWQSYWNNNTFDKATITLWDATNFKNREYHRTTDPMGFGNITLRWRSIGTNIKFEVDTVAQANDVIDVAAGTYTEGNPQVVINKNLTISGANKTTTIIKPAQNTGNSGDARGLVPG